MNFFTCDFSEPIEYKYEYKVVYETDEAGSENDDKEGYERLWSEADLDNDLKSDSTPRRRWRSWTTNPPSTSYRSPTSLMWHPKSDEEYDSDSYGNKGGKWKKNDQWQHYRDWLLRQGSQLPSPRLKESKPKSDTSIHGQHYQSWLNKQQSGSLRKLEAITNRPIPSKPKMPSFLYDPRSHWQHYQNWQRIENKGGFKAPKQPIYVFNKPDEDTEPIKDDNREADSSNESSSLNNKMPETTQDKTKNNLIKHWDNWLLEVAEDKKKSDHNENKLMEQNITESKNVYSTLESSENDLDKSSLGFTPSGSNNNYTNDIFSKVQLSDTNNPQNPHMSYRSTNTVKGPYFDSKSNFFLKSSFNQYSQPNKAWNATKRTNTSYFKPLTALQSHAPSARKTYGFAKNLVTKDCTLQGSSNDFPISTKSSQGKGQGITPSASSATGSGNPPKDSDYILLMEILVEKWINWVLQVTKNTKFKSYINNNNAKGEDSEEIAKAKQMDLIKKWNQFASVIPSLTDDTSSNNRIFWPTIDDYNVIGVSDKTQSMITNANNGISYEVDKKETNSINNLKTQTSNPSTENSQLDNFSSQVDDGESITEKPKRKYTKRVNAKSNTLSKSNQTITANIPSENLGTELGDVTDKNTVTAKPKRKYTRRENTKSNKQSNSASILDSEAENDTNQTSVEQDDVPKKRKYTKSSKNKKIETTFSEVSDTGLKINDSDSHPNLATESVNDYNKENDTLDENTKYSDFTETTHQQSLKEVNGTESMSGDGSIENSALTENNLKEEYKENSDPLKANLHTSVLNTEPGINNTPEYKTDSGLALTEESVDDFNINTSNIKSPNTPKIPHVETSNVVLKDQRFSSQSTEANSTELRMFPKQDSGNTNALPNSHLTTEHPTVTSNAPAKRKGHFYHYQNWVKMQAEKMQSSLQDNNSQYNKSLVSTKFIPRDATPPWQKKAENSFRLKNQLFGDHFTHYKTWLEKNGIRKTIYKSVSSSPDIIDPVPTTPFPTKTISLREKLNELSSTVLNSSTDSSQLPSDDKIQYLHQRWLVWQQKLASKMVDKINRRLKYLENPTIKSNTNPEDLKVKDMIKQRDYWREIQRWATKKTFSLYNQTPPQFEDQNVPESETRPEVTFWSGKDKQIVDFPQSHRMNPVGPSTIQSNPDDQQTTHGEKFHQKSLMDVAEKTGHVSIVTKPTRKLDVELPISKAAVRRSQPVKPGKHLLHMIIFT